ncbi:MAG TPA: hypothetical protein VK403_09325 [Allosphingosinicella sp.]|nr:hypothetical protein [Allosphingosinicella sp.]
MAQDDRKGQPPATRGKAPAPATTDISSAPEIHAPPPPEPPVIQPTAADPPAAAAGEAGDGDDASGAAGAAEAGPDAGSGEPEGDEDSPEDRTGDLEAEVEDAKQALKEKEAKLARHKEEVAAEQAAADLVKAYGAEVNALRLAEKDLEQYQEAETRFLSRFLDSEATEKIKAAATAAQAEIDRLAAKVSTDEADVAAKRKARDDAREEAAKARKRADSLKRPASSIRERLKAADAIRSQARKASDDAKYALAYWLVMPKGKLDEAIKAEPRILDPDKLRGHVKDARKAQQEAEQALTDREQALKEAEDKLRKDQAELADRRKKFDATVLKAVAALNPPIVKAA